MADEVDVLKKFDRLATSDIAKIVRPEELIDAFHLVYEALDDGVDEEAFFERCRVLANIYSELPTYSKLKFQNAMQDVPLTAITCFKNSIQEPRIHMVTDETVFSLLYHDECEEYHTVTKLFTYAFGNNRTHNLGLPSEGPVLIAKRTEIESMFTAAMSNTHTVIVSNENVLYGFGSSSAGQLGENLIAAKHVIKPARIWIPEGSILHDYAILDSYTFIILRHGSEQYTTYTLLIYGDCSNLDVSRSFSLVDLSHTRAHRSHCFHSPPLILTNPSIRSCAGKIYIYSPLNNYLYEVSVIKSNGASFVVMSLAYAETFWAYNILKQKENSPYLKLLNYTELWVNGVIVPVIVVSGHKSLENHDSYTLSYFCTETSWEFPVDVVLDGELVTNTNYPVVYTGKSGEIWMIMDDYVVTGKLKFMKTPQTDFTVKKPGTASMLDNFRLVAFVKQVPNTDGADYLCVSPDCQNVIYRRGIKLYHGMDLKQFDVLLKSKLDEPRWSPYIKRFPCLMDLLHFKKAHKHLSFTTNYRKDDLMTELMMALDMAQKYQDKRPADENVQCTLAKILVEMMKKLEFSCHLLESRDTPFHKKGHLEDVELNEALASMEFDFWYENANLIDQKMIQSSVPHPTTGCLLYAEVLKDAIETAKSRFESVVWELVPDQMYETVRLMISGSIKRLENIHNEDWNGNYHSSSFMQLEKLDRYLNHPRYHYRCLNLENLKKIQVEANHLNEEDVPLDMKVTITGFISNLKKTFYFNRDVHRLMFPLGLVENQELNWNNPVHEGLISFLFCGNKHRRDTIYVSKHFETKIIRRSPRNIEMIMRRKEEVTKFVPLRIHCTEVVILVCNDGQKIPCLKNLLLLHSSFLIEKINYDMRDFDVDKKLMFVYDQPETHEHCMHLDIHGSSTLVFQALLVLCDPSSLSERTLNEMIELVWFFNYYLMLEAQADVLDEIMGEIDETNIHLVFKLAHNFEHEIVERFVRNPRKLFLGLFKQMPPLHLMREVEKKLDFQDIIENEEEDEVEDDEEDSNTMLSTNYAQRSIQQIFFDKPVSGDIVEELRKEFMLMFPEADPSVFTKNLNILPKDQKKKTKGTRSRLNSSVSKVAEEVVVASPKHSPQKINEETVNPQQEPSNLQPCSSASIPINKSRPSQWDMSAVMPATQPSGVSPLAASPSLNDVPTPKAKTSGRFVKKGAKFVDASDLLQASPPPTTKTWNSPAPSNSPSTSFSKIQEEEASRKVEKAPATPNRSLVHIEAEDLAAREISTMMRRGVDDDASVSVEVVENRDEEQQAPMWRSTTSFL